ncbi:hypothetical protein [Peribacillus loiseleuriae]|uniref:hypothetical protein n=1 Tax=Peribacillus loiseleuriae TaxID=1679170 RepID=UPI003CFF9F96
MDPWKKSYSSLKLLSKKITTIDEKRGILDILFPSTLRQLIIELPHYDYLRGRVFVDDLKDVIEETPVDFSIYHLILVLYHDFLNQVKKGFKPLKPTDDTSTPYKNLASFFLSSKRRYLERPVEEKRVLTQVKENLFSFVTTIEESTVQSYQNKPKTAELTIRMREEDIYRGEVFLHDISTHMDDECLTIEDLIVILYLDFMNRIKESGNSKAAMQAIIDNFENL